MESGKGQRTEKDPHNILKCTGKRLQQRLIWLQMSIALSLSDSGLEEAS